MSYAAVDAVIERWVDSHGLTLCTEFAGEPRRFCYISAGEHESFQISVEPPEDRLVTINAWDVETEDDAELHRQWRVSVDDLAPTLEAAFRQIVEWSARPLTRRWGEIA